MSKYYSLAANNYDPETTLCFEKFPRRKRHTPHYSLDSLFGERSLFDKLLLAESRIVTAFCDATEVIRGRRYPTNNYICNVGRKQGSLVLHVYQQHVVGEGGFVTASELPDFITNRNLSVVIQRAEKDLLAAKLAEMVSQCAVWYNEYSTGIWEIVPSLVDKHRLDRETLRLIHKTEQQLRREGLHGGGRLRVVH